MGEGLELEFFNFNTDRFTREGRLKSSHHGPYVLGYTRVTKVNSKSYESVN